MGNQPPKGMSQPIETTGSPPVALPGPLPVRTVQHAVCRRCGNPVIKAGTLCGGVVCNAEADGDASRG